MPGSPKSAQSTNTNGRGFNPAKTKEQYLREHGAEYQESKAAYENGLKPDEFDIAIRNAALSDLLLSRKTSGRASTFVNGQRGIYSFDEPILQSERQKRGMVRPGGNPGRRTPTGKGDLIPPTPASPRTASATAITEAARTGLDFEVSPQFTFVTPDQVGGYDPDKTVLG